VAKIKGEFEKPAPATPKPAKAKRRISPEGMERIIAATKKMWAEGRSQEGRREKGGRKESAAKKTAPAVAQGATQTA